MARTCFVLHVKPDRRDDYWARHRNVWPEMIEALRSAGWRNYSLFMAPDGLLVGYVEADDFASAQRAMDSTEVNSRWQESVAELFEGGRADTSMQVLEEVFHLD